MAEEKLHPVHPGEVLQEEFLKPMGLSQKGSLSLTEPGHFVTGCNYWASHAGTNMWADWRPEVIEADFKQLSEAGLQVLRVFPLWPVFQPITQLYGGSGWSKEIRQGEAPLAEDEAGRAGVSAEAIERFAVFADMAQKYGLKLIVGLLTGWMSGRLFVPPALERLNVLTDPVAILWEVRFVRYFVKRFKGHPAVLAWDLGNECNCMAPVPSHEAAWTWTAAISNAIRAEDPGRPVVSGMHGEDEPDERAAWRLADQGELTDVLTTHPYPIFTPHCDQDPLNTLRNGLHATAQTRWYADVSGKPGLVEEMGSLGPMICSEAIAADYLRMSLFSTWANDCHGLLWWCAYDQAHLAHVPYDWNGIERELGLFRLDRNPKPVVGEYTKFRRFLQSLPIPSLPPRLTEAVCILTHGQETWGVVYASFILAKQAGFDLTFQYADEPLKEAELYLMPSVRGDNPFSRRFWLALAERIHRGAVLYLSHDDCLLSPFKDPFGLEVQTRQRSSAPSRVTLNGLPGSPAIWMSSNIRLTLAATGAEILGREADGNPAFSSMGYGLGKMYFLSFPIEKMLSSTPGAFSSPEAQPYWQIYHHLFHAVRTERVIAKENPLVGVTEHKLDKRHRVAVLINYSPEAVKAPIMLAAGWKPTETWYGPAPVPDATHWHCALGANDALVIALEKGK